MEKDSPLTEASKKGHTGIIFHSFSFQTGVSRLVHHNQCMGLVPNCSNLWDGTMYVHVIPVVFQEMYCKPVEISSQKVLEFLRKQRNPVTCFSNFIVSLT